MTYKKTETEESKSISSPTYNYLFSKDDGIFIRWGKTPDHDPFMSPYGPEILDIEISTGGCSMNCPFCYKNNKSTKGKNMSSDTFFKILDKIPDILTQVALGLTDLSANPFLFDILTGCRSRGIVPNFTITGIDLTEEWAKKLVGKVGAIAVSVYPGKKDIAYNAIKLLIDAGIKQINTHLIMSEETYLFVREVLVDRIEDKRLENLNAMVFLAVKPKGRAKENYTTLHKDKYKDIINLCLDSDIPFGFDSCSAPKFEYCIKDRGKDVEFLLKCSERCESSLFSLYINVDGLCWPCSFMEDGPEFDPINILEIDDFIEEVWKGWKLGIFREVLKSNNRECPVFSEIRI